MDHIQIYKYKSLSVAVCRLEQSIADANVGGRHQSQVCAGGQHLPQKPVASTQTPGVLSSDSSGSSKICPQEDGGLDDHPAVPEPRLTAQDNAVDMASSGGPVTEGVVGERGSRVGNSHLYRVQSRTAFGNFYCLIPCQGLQSTGSKCLCKFAGCQHEAAGASCPSAEFGASAEW